MRAKDMSRRERVKSEPAKSHQQDAPLYCHYFPQHAFERAFTTLFMLQRCEESFSGLTKDPTRFGSSWQCFELKALGLQLQGSFAAFCVL
jgi:hypothetical protein